MTATLRDVYLVRAAQGRRVLYIYQHGLRLRQEIEAEWRFVSYLAGNGLAVAPAIPRLGGGLLLTFQAPEGVRHGVLTPYVSGQHLRRRPSATAIMAYGRAIAQIHAAADALPTAIQRPVIDLESLLDRWVEAFADEMPDHPQAAAGLRDSAAYLLPLIEALPKEEPLYGLIHGDVIRANALVGDDEQVTVLDFDLCGYGWRSYDVASYLAVIRGTAGEHESEQAFLSGYGQIRSLAPVEIEALPVFEAIRTIFSLGIPAMNVHHWGRAYLEGFLERDLDCLRRIMERIQISRQTGSG
jgi:Ser/Thr protein kinase RdoA (MazF antagonist)